MNWTDISAKLAAGETATWDELEPASERSARFEVGVSKWSDVVGRAVVKVRLARVTYPEHSYGGPAGYLGSETFALADGQTGYERARVTALREAYRTRTASER